MTSIRQFVPIEKIGQGSFSSVYRVKRISDNKQYALKKVTKIYQVRMNSLSQKQKQNSINQVRILASIKSDFIIGYKQAFFDQNSNILCIVMQYANGGDLGKMIKTAIQQKTIFSQKQIWFALSCLIKGLKVLHDMKILHRDLKSANIFKSNGFYKLGDLNVSKIAKNNLVYTQTGTPYYASPQVWKDEPYDTKSDIWSLGCIIYQMICLKPPFRAYNMQGLYHKVLKGQYQKIPSRYSSDLAAVINICLKQNPKIRPSCNDIMNNCMFQKNIKKYLGLQLFPKKENKQQLIETIRIPKNLKGLQKNLPAANYDSTTTNVTQRNDKQKQFNSNKITRVQSSKIAQKQNKIKQIQNSIKEKQRKLEEFIKKQLCYKPKVYNCQKKTAIKKVHRGFSAGQLYRQNIKSPINNKKFQVKSKNINSRVPSAKVINQRPFWWG